MNLYCACGRLTAQVLHVHFSYPRTEYESEAMDPERVRGGGYHIATCGSPGCEADAFNVVREEVLVTLARVDCTPAQIAGLELTVWQPGDPAAYGYIITEDE